MFIAKPLGQRGSHILAVILLVAALGTAALIGLVVSGKQFHFGGSDSSDTLLAKEQNSGQPPTDPDGSPVWAFDERKLEWHVRSGKATSCADPFVFDRSPVDLSRAMAVGMPGAYRGYNYKPHGGIRFDDASGGDVDVRMPTEATLVGINRYYEGEPATLQYLLTFETDCGIAFRFDHLYTLAPEFQKLAETTPQPKLNDTRSVPDAGFARTRFAAGTLVASRVGLPQISNFGLDFGVYDYRSRNKISGDAQWAGLHTQYQATEWFGRCWTTMLPSADAATARKLSLTVINPQKPDIISDYCDYAPHTTLDFNDGKPTDG